MTKNWEKKSLGLHKERPSYRGSLQLSKSQRGYPTLQNMNFFFLLWGVIFALLDPPDPLTRLILVSNPDPQPCYLVWIASVASLKIPVYQGLSQVSITYFTLHDLTWPKSYIPRTISLYSKWTFSYRYRYRMCCNMGTSFESRYPSLFKKLQQDCTVLGRN